MCISPGKFRKVTPLAKLVDSPGLTVLWTPAGPLETNTYLVIAGPHAAVIDPAGEIPALASAAASHNAKIKHILLTHSHADHTAACAEAKERFPDALLVVPEAEADWLNHPAMSLSYFVGGLKPLPLPERTVKDGDIVTISTFHLKVLSLPGHTPGSTGYYSREHSLLFSGDALFQGSIGRVDLPGGDEDAMTASLKRLAALPPKTVVLPGHGPFTTIAEETTHNPFFSHPDST